MNVYKSIIFDHKTALNRVVIRQYTVWRTTQNHYDILNVNKNATSKDIKQAYYKKCKELHPDSNPNDPKSHDKFIKLQNAYNVLINDDTRRTYDSGLANPISSYSRPSYSNSRFYDRSQSHYEEQNNFYQHFGYNPHINEMFRRKYGFSKYNQRPNHSDGQYVSPIVVLIGLVTFIFILQATQFLFAYYSHSKRGNNPMMLSDVERAQLKKRFTNLDEAELDELLRSYIEFEEKRHIKKTKE